MNAGQEKFFQFIMASVKEESREEAEEMLKESFARQENATFDKDYLAGFIPKMMGLIKEENLEQVKGVMTQFQSNF